MNRILAFDRATRRRRRSSRASRSSSCGSASCPTAGGRASCPGRCSRRSAGAAAMNIHGKNNFAVGHDRRRDARVRHRAADGRGARPCSRERERRPLPRRDRRLRDARARSRASCSQTKRVHSGDLEVTASRARNLREVMDYFEARTRDAPTTSSAGSTASRAATRSAAAWSTTARYLAAGRGPGSAADAARRAPGAAARDPRRAEVRGVARAAAASTTTAACASSTPRSTRPGRLEAMQRPAPPVARRVRVPARLRARTGSGPTAARGQRGLIQYQTFVPHGDGARRVHARSSTRSQARGLRALPRRVQAPPPRSVLADARGRRLEPRARLQGDAREPRADLWRTAPTLTRARARGRRPLLLRQGPRDRPRRRARACCRPSKLDALPRAEAPARSRGPAADRPVAADLSR